MGGRACEGLVHRIAGNQMGMNLDIWSSRSVVASGDRTLGIAVTMLQNVRNVLLRPYFRQIKISGSIEAQFNDSGDDVARGCSAKAALEVELHGQRFSACEDNDLYDLEELAEKLEAEGSAQAPAVREALDQLSTFLQSLGNDRLADLEFWELHGGEHTITRELVDVCRVGEEIDWLALSKRVLHTKEVEPPITEPPLRWSRFELARVRDRLKLGMHPECMDSVGQSALNAAAFHGMEEAARALLSAGADPDRLDASSISPVVTAAYRGHADVLDRLLEAGGRIDGPAHAPTGLFVVASPTPSCRPLPLRDVVARGLDLHTPMPDGGTLADNVERYTLSDDNIRLVRAKVLSDDIAGAMGEGAPARPTSAKWGAPAL